MRIDKLHVGSFKNLQDFSIDFDQNQLTTVLIGENGTGKSNLVEALVLIFRDLDLEEPTTFPYEIEYRCRDQEIRISATPGTTWASSTEIQIDGKRISNTAFSRRKEKCLPANVFAYYSGPSRRLVSHFDSHQKRFYRAQLQGHSVEGLRRLFCARDVHSQFVLLAFYSIGDEPSRAFLKDKFGITGIESVQFVLRQPPWSKVRVEWPLGADQEDVDRFWGARGTVRDFLNKVWEVSTAPMYQDEKYAADFRSQPRTEQRLYLYLKDEEAIRALAKGYASQVSFFKDLESTYISDLIREVRISLRRKGLNEQLTFEQLSEGEQQLLTVMGLLRFTNEKESLFLLDEPDTHLNPIWKMQYLAMLEDCVRPKRNSQLIVATHEPLTVSGLLRSQVQMFEKDASGLATADPPDVDPRGLGVAGVLIELFGLPSTLDPQTLDKIQRRNELAAKKRRSEWEEDKLLQLSNELSSLGFSTTFRDPILTRFYAEALKRPEFRSPMLDRPSDAQVSVANEILDRILAEETKKDAS